MIAVENSQQAGSVAHKNATNLKHHWTSATIATILIALVLVMGVAVSMTLVAGTQDLRRAASTEDLTTTPAGDPPSCIAEGQSSQTPGNENLSCCEGLVGISCGTIGENNQLVSCGGGTVCTKCGDNACGLGENHFNCPSDCQQASVTCSWCGTTCAPDSPDRMCTMIAPPANQTCQVSSNQQTCEAVSTACLKKPSCLYDSPACTPELLPNQTFCMDADLDGDSDVDEQDYALLSQHFFKQTNASAQVDINHDGLVNIFDYALMVKQWTGNLH